MGYTTDFTGRIKLDRLLSEKQRNYLRLFIDTRRLGYNVDKLFLEHKGNYGFPFEELTEKSPEQIYGANGEYFIGDSKNYIDYNTPPGHDIFESSDYLLTHYKNKEKFKDGDIQPSLWCQWEIINEDNIDFLQWDGGEKFYEYISWLKYMIKHFFIPFGITLNGVITWVGEKHHDMGMIEVIDNVVNIKIGTITYQNI